MSSRSFKSVRDVAKAFNKLLPSNIQNVNAKIDEYARGTCGFVCFVPYSSMARGSTGEWVGWWRLSGFFFFLLFAVSFCFFFKSDFLLWYLNKVTSMFGSWLTAAGKVGLLSDATLYIILTGSTRGKMRSLMRCSVLGGIGWENAAVKTFE